MASPPAAIRAAQLGRRARHLDLEVGDLRQLAREPRPGTAPTAYAAQGRVLHHDGDARRPPRPREVLEHAGLVGAQAGAVIGRHEHQHVARRPAAARRPRSAAIRVEKWLLVTMTGTRPATCSRREIEQNVALVVGQQELLGVVGQDADAVDPLVDHAVEHAALAVEVEIAVVA